MVIVRGRTKDSRDVENWAHAPQRTLGESCCESDSCSDTVGNPKLSPNLAPAGAEEIEQGGLARRELARERRRDKPSEPVAMVRLATPPTPPPSPLPPPPVEEV